MNAFVTPIFPVGTLRFNYETIDPFGLPILASALLLFPENAPGALPLLSVQHGTLFLKDDAKSTSTSAYGSAAAFATLGYVTVLPDYLGMGDSPGYQAYLHARSEAICVVDALRAARTLSVSNGLALNGQLFLFGYSQGGHVTMATHRELEAFHTNEFTLTASAPCAGAYDLGGVTVESILANPNYPVPAFYPLIVASYLPIYKLGGSLEEILAEPYRRTLPPLLDGFHTLGQVGGAMPSDMFKILRPDFQADFRTNANNSIRLALSDNNLYEWTPRGPMKMFHCRGDRVVIFANSEVAYQSFTNRGACCVEVVDPGAPSQLDHSPCDIPSLRSAMAWFQQLKQ
jgi:pimeloyl-ACP methyl ester carboxylesterase